MSDDVAPPMPAPIRALLAQIAGMRAQLDALSLSVEALGYGMLANAARLQQTQRPGAEVPRPVFGAPPIAAPPVDASTERALAALDVPPSSPEVSP